MHSLYDDHMKFATDIVTLINTLDTGKWTTIHGNVDEVKCDEPFYLSYLYKRRYIVSNIHSKVVYGELGFSPYPSNENNNLWYTPGMTDFSRNNHKIYIPNSISEEEHFQLSLITDLDNLRDMIIFSHLNNQNIQNNLRIDTTLISTAIQYFNDVCMKR